jgi:hypothetical protein
MNAPQNLVNDNRYTVQAFDQQLELTIHQARYLATIQRNEFENIDAALLMIGLRQYAFEHTASSAMRDLHENKYHIAHDQLDALEASQAIASAVNCDTSFASASDVLNKEISHHSEMLGFFAASSAYQWKPIEHIIKQCNSIINRHDRQERKKSDKNKLRLKNRSSELPV